MAISPGSGDWVPESCTLPTVEQPLRVAEFDRLFRESVVSVQRPVPTRAELLLVGEAEPTARELAAREAECCSLFEFGFETTAAGTMMRIDVPGGSTSILDAIVERVRRAQR